jgi:serine/threonine-protein kinase
VSDTNTVTLTVSSLPAQVYLGDLRATAGYSTTGVASIKGVAYTHGVLQQQGSNYNPAKTTFTLSNHYTRLKGLVGLDDSFIGGGSVQVEIFDQDNKSLFKKTVKVGRPVPLDISVRGVIQLTLEATDLLTNVQNSGSVVWADAQLLSGS